MESGIKTPGAGRPKTSQEHAVEWLREAIVSRRLRPGQRVGQEDVAEQVGVSIVPVREAMRVLEREGQLTYRPRRGHFVNELWIEDLEEIYGLRELLEERAVRWTMTTFDETMKARLVDAARACRAAAEARNILGELTANREFHFCLMDAPEKPHTLRIITTLWDNTEAYRALYYNSAEETEAAMDAHDEIVALALDGKVDDLVAALDSHRSRALEVLREILSERT